MIVLPDFLGQALMITLMAIALGLDAFSLGIGIGLKGVCTFDILKLSTLTLIFHACLPLAGMEMGKYVSDLLGGYTTSVAGFLLLILGGHMFYSSLNQQSSAPQPLTTLRIFLVAFSISVDAFSVAVSLGIFAVSVWLTACLFGLFGGGLCLLGLILGRKTKTWLGNYGEAFGGVILFSFGLLFLI